MSTQREREGVQATPTNMGPQEGNRKPGPQSYLKGGIVFIVLDNSCKYVNEVPYQLPGVIQSLKRWINTVHSNSVKGEEVGEARPRKRMEVEQYQRRKGKGYKAEEERREKGEKGKGREGQ